MTILAISNASALESKTFSLVAEKVRSKNEKILAFKQDKCLDEEYLTFEVKQNKPTYSVVIDGIKHNLNKFNTVWYMHPMLPKELLSHKPAEFRQYIGNQFFAMRQAIWTLLRNMNWINDPWNVFISENKIYQLNIATKVGFIIPDTLITSDPNEVIKFYKTHSGNLIVKSFASSPMLGKVIMTNKITDEHMVNIDSVRRTPSIFQEYIDKLYELRITVVGNKIFPVKIYSQDDKSTSVDWRSRPKLNDFSVDMEQCKLPGEINVKIFSLMKMLGLRYGCIDMIVTPSGKYIFLEINPSGQWYFIQLNTGAKIANAIADMLIMG